MKRINIYLTETQVKRLKEKADALGIKFSELVRRALDSWLESEDAKKGDKTNDRTA